MFLSKNMFYIFSLQLVALQLLLAGDLTGQSLRDVELSISFQNVTLVEAFEEIHRQTGFHFVYDRSVSSIENRFSLTVSNQGLDRVLLTIAQDQRVKFKRINETISVIKDTERIRRNQRRNDWVIEVDRTLSGIIRDHVSGEPLIGATVQVKNTTIGTITDVTGNFRLDVPEEAAALVFSFIGYASEEAYIGNQIAFDITLNEDIAALEEVVVIGYGTGTKEKFNGAVSRIDNKQLNNYSSASFDQSIAGVLAGVQIIGNNKNPGDNSIIQIRGVNTLTAGTSPLIVVDGNPLTEGTSLSSINTNDIGSISILKDAASAAIYGSRASNGVIMITSKRGEEGNLRVVYDGYFGLQQRIDKFELADAYGTAQFDFDARNFGYISGGQGRSVSDDNATRDANGGGKRSRIPDYLPAYVSGTPGLTNTDWTDEVFRTARQQSHYLNLSGGTGTTDYSVSFSYLEQQNIIIDSDYERLTNNIRFNSQVNDRIRFGINSNVALTNANPTGEAGWSRSREGRGDQADPSLAIILMQPYFPVRNPDGSFAIAAQLDANNDHWDGPISENTVAQAELSDFTRHSFRLFGSAYAEIELVKDLSLRSSFGGDVGTGVEKYFGPSTFGNYRTPVADNPARAAQRDVRRENFLTEHLLSYEASVDAHTFDVLVGYTYQQEFRNRVDLESRDFADDNLRDIAGATTINATSQSRKWSLESLVSRLQYDYDDRYAISASLRRDGSSRFGANTKYGNFASLSAGWTLSNEVFFPQSITFSFAKVRASWGQTGNNQIGDFASVALVSEDNYVDNGTLVAGAYTNTSPNGDLSWETNEAFNLGFDLGIFQNKILLTAEYYNSKTSDLLLDVDVPQQSGFSESLQNIGELRNTGVELEMKGRGFSVGSLEVGFNANFATNNNEVLALAGDQRQVISNNTLGFITRVGDPIAQFYNYDIIGVYRSESEIANDPIEPLAGTEVGDYVVRDANGDGLINPDDRVALGDYNPDFTYGFGFSLEYKGFDIAAQFFGIEGREVADRMLYYSESGEGFFVPTQHYVDNYFNESNPEGFFRRPDFASFSSAGRLTRSSSLSVHDGDYFRLRSLQMGYNLPSSIIDYLGMESARVYLTGNNLFNITKYRGFNSDGIDTRSNERQTLTRGWIQTTAPLTRFIGIGARISF